MSLLDIVGPDPVGFRDRLKYFTGWGASYVVFTVMAVVPVLWIGGIAAGIARFLLGNAPH